MSLLHTTLIRIFCTGLEKGTLYYRSREFSLVHGKSAYNFYFILLSIQIHGPKRLALGGNRLGFVHIMLSVVETVELAPYELSGMRALLSSYISENISHNMLHLNEE